MTCTRFRDRLRHACVAVACLASVLEPIEGQTPVGSPPVAGSHALAPAQAPYTGDLDGMAARRTIRILTPYNRTQFFIDKGVPRGIAAETGLAFEEQINRTLKTTRSTHISVVFIPTSRDQLHQSLVAGRGDIVLAPLAITAERRKNADFTTPVRRNAREILVTGPGAPPIGSLDDVAGQVVAINPKTIYAESLAALNATLKRHSKPLVIIKALPETLEDDDVLEMVNAGLVTATITEDWLADVWKAALPDLTIHSNLVLREDAELALAVRRNSPALLAEVNAFLADRGAGALSGNVVEQRDMTSAAFVKRATSDAEMKKFRAMAGLFRARAKGERVVSEKVGRQPSVYVSNIYKYYVAYTLAMDEWRWPPEDPPEVSTSPCEGVRTSGHTSGDEP